MCCNTILYIETRESDKFILNHFMTCGYVNKIIVAGHARTLATSHATTLRLYIEGTACSVMDSITTAYCRCAM